MASSMWLVFCSPLIQLPTLQNHLLALLFINLAYSSLITTSTHTILISKSSNICLERPPGPMKRQIPSVCVWGKAIKCVHMLTQDKDGVARLREGFLGDILAGDRESEDC